MPMNFYQYIHELVFGALAVNLVLFLGIIKSGWKVYRLISDKNDQHDLMWEDYCYREKLRKDRLHGNMIRKANKKNREQYDNGSSDDSPA